MKKRERQRLLERQSGIRLEMAAIDELVRQLLDERALLSEGMALVKMALGEETHNPGLEERKLGLLCRRPRKSRMAPPFLRSVFVLTFDESRRIQRVSRSWRRATTTPK